MVKLIILAQSSNLALPYLAIILSSIWWCCHWCFKSINSGFARVILPYLKNFEIWNQRIEAKILMNDTPWDTKEKALGGLLEKLANLFGHMFHLSLMLTTLSHQSMKPKCCGILNLITVVHPYCSRSPNVSRVICHMSCVTCHV